MKVVRTVMAGAVLTLAMGAADASARRHTTQQEVVTCDQRGCSDNVQQYNPGMQQPTFTQQRVRRSTRRHEQVDYHRGRPLVHIQCGPRSIKVANTAAIQFAGFCKEFYAQYRWKVVGGWRGGTCAEGSRHPCGGAIDIEQECRSKGPGYCGVKKDFPVALSEHIAAKWGIFPGSKWDNKDVGHFQIYGSLAGNGKWTPPEVLTASADPTEKIEEPASVDKTLETMEENPPPSNMTVTIDPLVSAYTITEYPQYEVRPAVKAVADLKSVPMGSVKEEIKRISKMFGLPDIMMRAFARIESDFNPKNRTGKYKGLFQLSNYEFEKHGGGGNIFNARDNTIAAAAKFASDATQFEMQTTKTPTYSDLYLIHQQGWQGAAQHVAHPDWVAWRSMCATDEGHEKGEHWCRKAIWGNVPSNLKGHGAFKSVETLTSGNFAAMWKSKVDRFSTQTKTVEKAEPEHHSVRVRHHHRHRHHRYAGIWPISTTTNT